jgi:hypothetical protein
LRKIWPFTAILLYLGMLFDMGVVPVWAQILDMYTKYPGLLTDYLFLGTKLPAKLVLYLGVFLTVKRNINTFPMLLHLHSIKSRWLQLHPRRFSMREYALRARELEQRRR